jgi:hypothetical protein
MNGAIWFAIKVAAVSCGLVVALLVGAVLGLAALCAVAALLSGVDGDEPD